jgi:hypothetical protein
LQALQARDKEGKEHLRFRDKTEIALPNTICHHSCKFWEHRNLEDEVYIDRDEGVILCGGVYSGPYQYSVPTGRAKLYIARNADGSEKWDTFSADPPTQPFCNRKIHWKCAGFGSEPQEDWFCDQCEAIAAEKAVLAAEERRTAGKLLAKAPLSSPASRKYSLPSTPSPSAVPMAVSRQQQQQQQRQARQQIATGGSKTSADCGSAAPRNHSSPVPPSTQSSLPRGFCGTGLGIDWEPRLPDPLGDYDAPASISIAKFHCDTMPRTVHACIEAAAALVRSVMVKQSQQLQEPRSPQYRTLPEVIERLVKEPEAGEARSVCAAPEISRAYADSLANQLLYFAPELTDEEGGHWTEASDVYALGFFLLQLFGGSSCILQDGAGSAEDRLEIFNLIVCGEEVEHSIAYGAKCALRELRTNRSLSLIGVDLQQLIKNCWKKDKTSRPSLGSISAMLRKCRFVQMRQNDLLLYQNAHVAERQSLLEIQFGDQTCHDLLSKLAEKWRNDSLPRVDDITRILAASLMIFPGMPDDALWTRWAAKYKSHRGSVDDITEIDETLEIFLRGALATSDFASKRVEIKKAEHQSGLFASEAIAEGDVIAMYSGMLYAQHEHLRICQSTSLLYHKSAYWLGITIFGRKDDYLIDAYPNHGSAAMAINDFTKFDADGKAASVQDRASINCAFEEIAHCGWKYVVVRATADVAVGSELLIEYGSLYWSHAGKTREPLEMARHVSVSVTGLLL